MTNEQIIFFFRYFAVGMGRQTTYSYYGSLLRLGIPVVASQMGHMLTVMADTIMVGGLGATQLAAVSFAGNISVPVLVAGMGVSLCVTPLVGKRYGAMRHNSIALCLKHLQLLNILIGLFQVALLALFWYLMPYMGQPAEVVELARGYMPIIIASMLPCQIFTGYKQFIEGLQNTKTPMVISLIGNALNIMFNYVFIYGFWFVDAIGVNGAAWSTLLSRVFMWLAISVVVRRMDLCRAYFSAKRRIRLSARVLKHILTMGLPIGGQMAVECLAFALGGIMMGWIGTAEIAAHEIVMTFTSLTFMMASGISSAITIKVSLFCGQRDRQAIRLNSYAAIQLSLIFMACTAILFITLRNVVPALIIDSAQAVEIAAQLMIVAGCFQLFDGTQVTVMGILRGLGDMRFPPLVSTVAYVVTCLPIGYLLAFTCGCGAWGIWIGYLVGLVVACAMLLMRMRLKMRKIPF